MYTKKQNLLDSVYRLDGLSQCVKGVYEFFVHVKFIVIVCEK